MQELKDLFQGEISKPSRIALLLISLALIPALFLPVWEITLHAPQYPDGLTMEIMSHTVTGDLQEINNLNHYIGMQEISPDEFPEFNFIPFFIGRFLLLAGLAFLVARMSVAAIGYIDFAVFGAVMMWDFQHWMYEYGHNLSPDAPIEIEPFTPTILGATEVGQFSVTAYPDWGGILMLVAGAAGPVILGYEWWRRRKKGGEAA